MTHIEQRAPQLPEYTVIEPDQLPFGRLPNIQQVDFFNGRFSVRGGNDSLRMSVVAASAADISQQELKDRIGATPDSRLELVVDTVYERMHMTTPEDVGKMVARAWQRGLLQSEQDIRLSDLQNVRLERLPRPLINILGALSCEASLQSIQALPELSNISVDRTVERFQAATGIRSLAGVITFGFMTGAVQSKAHGDIPGPRGIIPLGVKRGDRTIIPLQQTAFPSVTTPRKKASHPPATAKPVEPSRPSGAPALPESRPPEDAKGFNIPSYMRIIAPKANRPKGEAWPDRIEAPKLDGCCIHWGGGIFRVNLPRDEALKQVFSRALVLSCFDLSNQEIADMYGIGNGSYQNVRSSQAYAQRILDIPAKMARTVETLFDRRWLSVVKYMPQPTNAFFEDSLELVRVLPGSTDRQEVANKMGVEFFNVTNIFKKTYQSFGVTNCRGLLTRAYGLGIWVPPKLDQAQNGVRPGRK